MGMRRAPRLIAVVVGLMVLTGCSPPPAHGVRLNADGTIDFVDCYGAGESISVDFSDGWSDDTSPEWEATSTTTGEPGEVIRYGEPPSGYSTTRLVDPPSNWTVVDFGLWPHHRSDLVEGEWEWVNGTTYPWVPEHPCDGVDLEELTR